MTDVLYSKKQTIRSGKLLGLPAFRFLCNHRGGTAFLPPEKAHAMRRYTTGACNAPLRSAFCAYHRVGAAFLPHAKAHAMRRYTGRMQCAATQGACNAPLRSAFCAYHCVGAAFLPPEKAHAMRRYTRARATRPYAFELSNGCERRFCCCCCCRRRHLSSRHARTLAFTRKAGMEDSRYPCWLS